jgi:CHAD domain-containing protein
MAEAGRKILKYYFAEMLAHEKGTKLGEDIEELHDMRVATRRMRSAFSVFGGYFRKRSIKNYLKGLRATGKALGRVRDLDVFMEKADRYLETREENTRLGLSPLIDDWAEERETDRKKMIRYLNSPEYQEFVQDFNEFVQTPGMGVREARDDNMHLSLVQQAAPMLIYTSLASVRAYDVLIPTANIEQLHALRIEFKKLRYTVEFFRVVLGEESRAVIFDIKALQDHLGDLNDADVACKILGDFLTEWESKQMSLPLRERKNPEPVVEYLAAKHAERHTLMTSFPEAWNHFNRPEFRRNLALAVSVL